MARPHRLVRSCGATANQSVAFASMARSCWSCRFARQRRASSSRSRLVGPSSLTPSSISACLIQTKIVAAQGSNSCAKLSTLRSDLANAMIWSLKSAGYEGFGSGHVAPMSEPRRVCRRLILVSCAAISSFSRPAQKLASASADDVHGRGVSFGGHRVS